MANRGLKVDVTNSSMHFALQRRLLCALCAHSFASTLKPGLKVGRLGKWPRGACTAGRCVTTSLESKAQITLQANAQALFVFFFWWFVAVLDRNSGDDATLPLMQRWSAAHVWTLEVRQCWFPDNYKMSARIALLKFGQAVSFVKSRPPWFTCLSTASSKRSDPV